MWPMTARRGSPPRVWGFGSFGPRARTAHVLIVCPGHTIVQAALLHDRGTPTQPRLELSRALGAVRSARTMPATGSQNEAASAVDQPAKLADMLRADYLAAKSSAPLRPGSCRADLADSHQQHFWLSDEFVDLSEPGGALLSQPRTG